MRKKREPSKKAAKRALLRSHDKLVRDRERLAALEPGGAPEQPIVVSSASLVEPRARAFSCLACGEHLRVDQHAAETIAERRLRVVTLTCPACGKRRVLFFEIAAPLLN